MRIWIMNDLTKFEVCFKWKHFKKCFPETKFYRILDEKLQSRQLFSPKKEMTIIEALI